jgi:hypothetical protein
MTANDDGKVASGYGPTKGKGNGTAVIVKLLLGLN